MLRELLMKQENLNKLIGKKLKLFSMTNKIIFFLIAITFFSMLYVVNNQYFMYHSFKIVFSFVAYVVAIIIYSLVCSHENSSLVLNPDNFVINYREGVKKIILILAITEIFIDSSFVFRRGYIDRGFVAIKMTVKTNNEEVFIQTCNIDTIVKFVSYLESKGIVVKYINDSIKRIIKNFNVNSFSIAKFIYYVVIGGFILLLICCAILAGNKI